MSASGSSDPAEFLVGLGSYFNPPGFAPASAITTSIDVGPDGNPIINTSTGAGTYDRVVELVKDIPYIVTHPDKLVTFLENTMRFNGPWHMGYTAEEVAHNFIRPMQELEARDLGLQAGVPDMVPAAASGPKTAVTINVDNDLDGVPDGTAFLTEDGQVLSHTSKAYANKKLQVWHNLRNEHAMTQDSATGLFTAMKSPYCEGMMMKTGAEVPHVGQPVHVTQENSIKAKCFFTKDGRHMKNGNWTGGRELLTLGTKDAYKSPEAVEYLLGLDHRMPVIVGDQVAHIPTETLLSMDEHLDAQEDGRPKGVIYFTEPDMDTEGKAPKFFSMPDSTWENAKVESMKLGDGMFQAMVHPEPYMKEDGTMITCSSMSSHTLKQLAQSVRRTIDAKGRLLAKHLAHVAETDARSSNLPTGDAFIASGGTAVAVPEDELADALRAMSLGSIPVMDSSRSMGSYSGNMYSNANHGQGFFGDLKDNVGDLFQFAKKGVGVASDVGARTLGNVPLIGDVVRQINDPVREKETEEQNAALQRALIAARSRARTMNPRNFNVPQNFSFARRNVPLTRRVLVYTGENFPENHGLVGFQNEEGNLYETKDVNSQLSAMTGSAIADHVWKDLTKRYQSIIKPVQGKISSFVTSKAFITHKSSKGGEKTSMGVVDAIEVGHKITSNRDVEIPINGKKTTLKKGDTMRMSTIVTGLKTGKPRITHVTTDGFSTTKDGVESEIVKIEVPEGEEMATGYGLRVHKKHEGSKNTSLLAYVMDEKK